MFRFDKALGRFNRYLNVYDMYTYMYMYIFNLQWNIYTYLLEVITIWVTQDVIILHDSNV